MANGKVYIVGAGPGNPDLITIKAANVLKVCDVVLYDRLVSMALLDLCREDCKRIYVGKEAGKIGISQEEIIKLMIAEAMDGKIVARLKGGDPYLFGRGSEEALALANEGLQFEVIPGISAAFGASAFSGIPLTHRNLVAQCVFITAHESPAKKSSQIQWEKLAQMTNTTLVIYMGGALLSDISNTLIKYGLSGDFPAAIVENATLPNQRVVITKVSELASAADKYEIRSPVLLIISPNVQFYQQISWFQAKPLFGKKILITRASDQSSSLYKMLLEEGAMPVLFPVIKTSQIIPQIEFKDVLKKKKYDWLIFTSENGVRYFFNMLMKEGLDCRSLAEIKIAVLGTGTNSKLSEFGITADLMPDRFTSDFLVQDLALRENLKNKRILRIKGDFKFDPLADGLRNQGAEVDTFEVYETKYTHQNQEEITKTLSSGIDAAIFTSCSTIEAFMNIVGIEVGCTLLNKIKVIAIGPVTANRIRNFGITNVIISKQHNIQGIVDTIKQELIIQ